MEIGTSIQLAHDDQDASPCGLLQLYKITPRSPGLYEICWVFIKLPKLCEVDCLASLGVCGSPFLHLTVFSISHPLSQPHRKKKSFIQKKSSVTFHLVHRSQKDPLVADENAPQRVLLPAEVRQL